MRFFISLTVHLILLIIISNNTFSQEKIAILVANQNYYTGNKLKNPVNDINEIKSSLENVGYKTILFQDLTLQDFNGKLMDSIRNILSINQKKTKLFFHYAGHGIQIDNENYLIPIDLGKVEYKSDIKRKCFNFSSLLEVLSEITDVNPSLTGLISIDACRNNPFLVEGVTQGLAKPQLNNKIYSNFGILYSVGINQTAADGNGKLSPYIKGVLKSINNCEDLKLMSDRIIAEYYIEGLEKEPYFEGSLNFLFCEGSNSKKILNNDWTEEYNSILNLLFIDFLNQNYESLLVKAVLIDRIVASDRSKIDRQSYEYLQYELYVAIAQFKLGQFGESYQLLTKLTDNSLKANTIDIFIEAYFYLGRLYTIDQKWDELFNLRKRYLKYLLDNDNVFDAAITYDKIAGDFEHQNFQDLAIANYKKAVELFDQINILSSEEKHYASLVNGNIGRCYAYGQNLDFTKSLIYLQKSLTLSVGNNELMSSNLRDLIAVQLSLDTTAEIEKEIFNNLIDLNDLCIKSQDKFDDFYYLDLAITYNNKYANQDSLNSSFKKLNDLILSQNSVVLENDTLLVRNVENSCSIYSRQISLVLPKGVLPILFFDKNKNLIFDDRDYKIIADNSEIDTVIITEFGSNSTEQWVIYNSTKIAKNTGIFYLSHNNSHLKTSTTNYSYCLVYPKLDSVFWQFRIDCSELEISKSNMFIGLLHTNLSQNNQVLITDNTLRFIPIASFNDNCLKYSISTLEDFISPLSK